MWWRHGPCRPFLTALKKNISCSENAVSVPAPMVCHNTADYQPGSCTLLLFVHVNADVFGFPFLVASLPDGSSVESPHKSKFKWAHSQLIDSLQIGVLSDVLKKKSETKSHVGKNVSDILNISPNVPYSGIFWFCITKAFLCRVPTAALSLTHVPEKKKNKTWICVPLYYGALSFSTGTEDDPLLNQSGCDKRGQGCSCFNKTRRLIPCESPRAALGSANTHRIRAGRWTAANLCITRWRRSSFITNKTQWVKPSKLIGQ